jgi:ABC-type sulfate transport system permease component
MPRFNNSRAPQGPTWFDWLPQKVQCVLLLLLTLPVTAILFFTGMRCVHTGQPIVLGNTRTDAFEWFFLSAGFLVISGGIFAVLMGWAKSATPHVSETHHRKP